jgi:hypothetical protein
MSSTTFTAISIALWNGVDVVGYVNKVREWIGLSKHTDDASGTDGDGAQDTQEKSIVMTLLLAFSLNKLLSPLKVICTLWLTPRLVRFLRRR